MSIVSLALLVLWGVWWTNSVKKDRLVHGQHLWLPELPFLAGDFVVHIDRTSRLWLAGGNPYQPENPGLAYPYPPLIPRVFLWTSLMAPSSAVAVWLSAITGFGALGAWGAWQARRRLGIRDIPLAVVIVAVLYSSPMIFAMERGQCDILLIPIVLAAVGLLGVSTTRADWIAGMLLAVMPWVKYYPGLVVVGLLALRRWWALGAFVPTATLIGLIDRRWILESFENARMVVGLFVLPKEAVHVGEHSISGNWQIFWLNAKWPWLAEVPGTIVAAACILPLVAWVSYQVFRCRDASRLTYPYLLWVLAAATFVPPVANDYNLFFLPMAALAVWDRRDPVIVHMLMAFLLVWWQPFWLPIGGSVLLACKLGGLVAVAMSLARRAEEQADNTGRRSLLGPISQATVSPTR